MPIVLERCGVDNVIGEFRCTGHGNSGHGCNSLLRILKSDLYVTVSYDRDGTFERYITFACPVCYAENDVDNFPDHLRWSLPTRVEHVKRQITAQK